MLAHNVAALLKSPAGATRQVEIDEPDPRFASEMDISPPVTGQAYLMRIPEGIVARADLEATVRQECSRCLEPFMQPISTHFEEMYRPSVSVSTGAPLPAGEDEALQIDEHHVLDLTETARQYLLTAIPVKPVCRPDCQGLCPNCGANLNTEECRCSDEPVSGPFAALANLLHDDDAGPRRD
jgi:uncharacterized protein